MDVSVIIVNYNTKDLTKSCIDSVVKHTKGLEYEIILVDNASSDGSSKTFEKDERINFIQSNTNLGFGKANNLGFSYSKGKYIFLLNSDTVLLNNAIHYFYDYMEHCDSRVSCLGCVLMGGDGKKTHSYGNFPTLWNELIRKPLSFFRRFRYVKAGFDVPPKYIIDNHCFVVEYITGADLFLRRNVAEEYGLFDPDFFMYYEETEMQYRYRKNGFISCIINTPKILHLEGGSQKKTNRWNWKSIPGLMICYRKMYGLSKMRLFKVLFLLFTIPVAVIDWRYPIKIRLEYINKVIKS